MLLDTHNSEGFKESQKMIGRNPGTGEVASVALPAISDVFADMAGLEKKYGLIQV